MALDVRVGERRTAEIIESRQGESIERHWWHQPPGKARADAIRASVEQIETDQSSRRAMDELYMRAYGAGNVAGEGLAVALRWQQRQHFRLRLNLIEQVCDAMQAKVAQMRPRPACIVTQGDWGLRKKADAVEQAMDGEFYRNRVDQKAPRVALDGFVVGTGFFKVGRTGVGYPVVDRVFPGEILVDHLEGLYQEPQTLYQTRLVDREYLIDRFAEKNTQLAADIRKIPAATLRSYPWLRTARGHTDCVLVIEAWHLPCSPDDDDGWHTISGGSVELLEPKQTQYREMQFPIVPYRWQSRQFGYFGRGIAEEIMPQQVEINYTLEKIQHILHNVSTVRHYVQAGGKIKLNVTRMSNTPGEMIEYFGANPPVAEVLNAVPSEMFQHVITLKNDAFEAVGLSAAFAQSTKPAGLDSGEAQRVYEDVGTARLILKGREYEQTHIELTERIVAVKRAIAKDPRGEKESPVMVKAKRARGVTVRSLRWSDIDLGEQPYIWETLPQSSMPGTPQGRKATVAEWLQQGLITPDVGRELLSLPDIKSNNDSHFATRDSVLSAIELMSDDGQWCPPHPLLNLSEAKTLVAAAFTRLEWQGLADDRLELIARYAAALVALETAAAPPPAAPMAPATGGLTGPQNVNPQQPVMAPPGSMQALGTAA